MVRHEVLLLNREHTRLHDRVNQACPLTAITRKDVVQRALFTGITRVIIKQVGVARFGSMFGVKRAVKGVA